jgi:hypothetical protein
MLSETEDTSQRPESSSDPEALYARWRESLATFKAVINAYSTDKGGDDTALECSVTALHTSSADCYDLSSPLRFAATDGRSTTDDLEGNFIGHFATVRGALPSWHRLCTTNMTQKTTLLLIPGSLKSRHRTQGRMK